ncbi:glycosyltransferase family 2 protein [Polaribacter sp. R77954]|uniref:glycosyltransferase family 2 protein n=1 Tax=Polaribacter sp. R77954 TaxID=3093870 RepID=UPI0037C6635A
MISVVIPLYNKAHTIVNTLKTVLDQTFQEYEVVIVNDGSTDNSVEVINGYTTDKRIKIFNQNNQGVSGARNTGVENAQYNYIAFLDGDDEWLSTYLQKMKEAIEAFPKSAFFCSAGMGKNSKGYGKPRQIDKYKGKIVHFEFFENPHVFLHISAVVVTKELFYKVGGFPLGMKRNEDFTFLYKAALLSKPVYSGFPLSVYVGDVNGQATNTSIYESEKLIQDTVDRYNMVYETYEETDKKDKLFIVFMKYELRHFFMINTINKEYAANHFFLKKLDAKILAQFNLLELCLLRNSNRIRKIYIFYIKFTKLIWRLNGFERVK